MSTPSQEQPLELAPTWPWPWHRHLSLAPWRWFFRARVSLARWVYNWRAKMTMVVPTKKVAIKLLAFTMGFSAVDVRLIILWRFFTLVNHWKATFVGPYIVRLMVNPGMVPAGAHLVAATHGCFGLDHTWADSGAGGSSHSSKPSRNIFYSWVIFRHLWLLGATKTGDFREWSKIQSIMNVKKTSNPIPKPPTHPAMRGSQRGGIPSRHHEQYESY